MKLQLDNQNVQPLVTQLREQLRAQMRSGSLMPGQRLPSMRQLSKDCQVSLGIVKQAINTLTVEGMLRSHPGAGVFVAEQPAKVQNIALVLPSLDIDQMPRIIRGIKQTFKNDGIRLQIHAADCDYDQEADMLEVLDHASVDGAIVYPPPLKQYANSLKELHRRGVPVVLVDTGLPGLDIHAVITDSVEQSRMIFEHLLTRGHRKIGMVGHEELHGMDVGADSALKAYGLSYKKLACVNVNAMDLNPTQPWANAEKATLKLLEAHPDLTAIVGMNDHLGMGVLRGVKASGRRVPEDVSVIAASNLSAFENTEPNVTAIDQMHERMGALAAQMLQNVMLGQLDDTPMVIRLKPRLIERKSVRCL